MSVGALTQSTTVYADSAVVQTANAEKNSVLEERRSARWLPAAAIRSTSCGRCQGCRRT